MEWLQMCPDGLLRELSHPCVETGHAPGRYPAVTTVHRVVEAVDENECPQTPDSH
jgi:hypothetical protein